MTGSKSRHGHTSRGHTVGKNLSPTYSSWQAMRTRCVSTSRDNFDRYATVRICARWDTFENFLADMGERPEGKTLDRYPNHKGNYEPLNCRWATPTEQARNTRNSKLTLETATQVAVLRLRGITCKIIAAQYGISESLPREIVKGRCWTDALEAAKKIVGIV